MSKILALLAWSPAWCLLWLAGCATDSKAIDRSHGYASEGNYYLAYKSLEEVRDPDHPDQELEKAYWRARLDYLIDEARRLIFNNRELNALDNLSQAQALAPENVVVKALVQRAEEKLASRATDRGNIFLAEGNLEQALLAFTDAQAHVPGYQRAIESTQSVRAAFDKLQQKAQEHFLEAVRRFPELRWVEVDWHAEIAIENDPSRDDARDLQLRSKRKIAERAFQRAGLAERTGHYGAALMEYRSVRDRQPEYPGIGDYITSMQHEVEAQSMIEKALAMMVNKRFVDAREVLGKAFQLTVLEKASISELLLQTRRREGLAQLQSAKDLDLLGKKSEALLAMQQVAAAWPDGLADEKVRIDNLQHDIDGAVQAFAAGEAAEQQGDPKTALQRYQEVETFYPGYKDARQRLERLRAQLQQPKATESSNGG